MASGTKHFIYNRPSDWLEMGLLDMLSADDKGLSLQNAKKGVYVSFALDTLEEKTVWHRLRVCSRLPENSLLQIYIYCSDDDEVPAAYRAPDKTLLKLDDWLKTASAAERESFFEANAQQRFDFPNDLPLYGFCGRYLWFCFVFSSYGGEDMSVQSIKLEFPRVAFIDYLPQVYRGEDSTNSFLARFISIFQSIYVDLEDEIDIAPTRCDPSVAPPDFLKWLADCLAVSESFLWSEERLRELLKNAVRLYRIKGTKDCLRQVIELYTGHTPLIIERFEVAASEVWKCDKDALSGLYGSNARTTTILMPPGEADIDYYAKIWKVIDSFRPVDSVCKLVLLENSLIAGQHCYLGINSRIGKSSALILDSRTIDSSAPLLME